MKASTFDIVIAGGGLVGASCALALGRRGVRTALITADAGLLATTQAGDWDARIYAVSPASMRFLRNIGVWSRLDVQRIAPCTRMEIFGDRDGAHLAFDAYEAGTTALAYMLESRALAAAIDEALQSVACVVRRGPVVGLNRDAGGADVVLASGESLRCALLVGADGAASGVRELAGMQAQRHDYASHAVVANFSIGKPHRGCACQWFRGADVLALLPLPGNRISMVWSAHEAEAHRLLALAESALADAVAEASGGRLGRLELVTPARSFPLARLHVADPVAERVVLIGDAAHVVHPLAGQGVNLGFGDAMALAEVITERGPILDPGAMALLRRYRRRRAEPILAMLAMTHGLHGLFALPGGLPRFFRNTGLNLLRRVPVVRSMLARQAMS
ncbi:MAG: 2-octaprenyl-3-methyl-6-methoxy-1,4-benzoquinol hydroxylase [Betaproteobacteria bacterium]|nr:2-octaprenyl-3-methyl-6-methoxy-1,4-benzoquinol hydroxylase [Betaproteobacteria bacterium]